MAGAFRGLGRLAALMGLACWASSSLLVARAELILDPRPPMRWAEMIACELVVVAKYESHQAKTLRLHIVRVLKGKDSKPGDIVSATLEHWYSVETGATGWRAMTREAKGDGLPRLCYKVQMINPGPLVPVPVVADVRQPAVYFFSKAAQPVLSRRGQVQCALFADGWAQAVNREPMGLLFRLMQAASARIARDALEELYRTREPKTIAKLIDWTIKPPVDPSRNHGPKRIAEADRILLTIGDRGGDIYNPLFQWYTKGGKPSGQYAQYRVGRLLARIDGGRAFLDFSKMIRQGNAWEKTNATRPLGYVRIEKAVALCIELLEDEQLAPSAARSLRAGLSVSVPREEQATVSRLRAFARPLLLRALASPNVHESHKRELRGAFANLVGVPPAVDLAEAEQVLLNAKDQTYHGMAEGKGHKLFQAISRTPELGFVPLLARILRDVPAARKHRAYGFQRAFRAYAALFPNAMRRELRRRGIDREFLRKGSDAAHAVRAHVAGLLGPPAGIEGLRALVDKHGPEWIREHGLPEDTLADLKKFIEPYAARGTLPYRYAHWLSLADPEAAKALVDKALARRQMNASPASRAPVLALAIRFGHRGLVDDLTRDVEAAIAGERKEGSTPSSARYLLVSQDARALAAYLARLDAIKQVRESRFGNRLHVDFEFERMLSGLRQEHPDEYFRRILALAASDSHPQRELAEGELAWFGYCASAFAVEREKTLRRILPIVERFARMSPAERRRLLLGLRGIRLDGEPGKAWLPTLVCAAGHHDFTVSRAALDLIRDITGQGSARAILSYPYHERERIVRLWLADRGVEAKPAPR